MIFSPSYFIAFAIISSVSEEQSTPHPSFFKISITNGFGVAFTAKYSLNPLFQEMHASGARHSRGFPFHHTGGTVSGMFS